MKASDPFRQPRFWWVKAIVGIVIGLAGVSVSTVRADLTGRYSGNDGGTYFLRQIDDRIYWYGEARTGSRPAWANVFSGRLREGRISGRWADLPNGRMAGYGRLVLAVEQQGTVLRALEKTGGLNGSRWVRQPAAAPPPLRPATPSANQDCVGIDPGAVHLHHANGHWKLIDGSRWLFDFGTDRSAAQRALQVIVHYRMNRSCFVGRPNSSFGYLLAKGGAPTGPMAGEDCVAFDPATLRVSRTNDRWKIVADRRWLFDLGASEADAQKALTIIRRYGFNRSCFVGRPNAPFAYLRR